MTITSPQLVSASAFPDQILSFNAGADTYVLVSKAHQGLGFPRREFELFTVADIIANETGTYFFNIVPRRIEILQENFAESTGINTSGTRARLYYTTPSIAILTIFAQDLDLASRFATAPRTIFPFEGVDPFVMDARTMDNPNTIYLVYAGDDGSCRVNVSANLGTSWNPTITVDDSTSKVRLVEGVFTDPQAARQNVELLEKRDFTVPPP